MLNTSGIVDLKHRILPFYGGTASKVKIGDVTIESFNFQETERPRVQIAAEPLTDVPTVITAFVKIERYGNTVRLDDVVCDRTMRVFSSRVGMGQGFPSKSFDEGQAIPRRYSSGDLITLEMYQAIIDDLTEAYDGYQVMPEHTAQIVSRHVIEMKHARFLKQRKDDQVAYERDELERIVNMDDVRWGMF